jgi:hypothetical protein
LNFGMRSSTVPACVSPHPGALAVALIVSLRGTRAVSGAGQSFDLQFHKPLRGQAHHLAQEISVGTLLQKATKVHHVISHPRIKSGDRILGSC